MILIKYIRTLDAAVVVDDDDDDDNEDDDEDVVVEYYYFFASLFKSFLSSHRLFPFCSYHLPSVYVSLLLWIYLLCLPSQRFQTRIFSANIKDLLIDKFQIFQIP